jgi:hypothetical protein
MSDPNGINYPSDPELRSLLAEEIRKLQSDPARQEAVAGADRWPEYVASMVQRLEAASRNKGDEE